MTGFGIQEPCIELAESPLAPGVSPVRIAVRDHGRGRPLMILHGGWGYDAYPFDTQIAAFSSSHRVIIPDRSGYGGSTPIERLPVDFHQRAAGETLRVIDALKLDRPVLWGHSDGAIIALMVGLGAPDRIAGVIAEATHFYRQKPRSRAFFERVIAAPRSKLVETHARTWLEIGDAASGPADDFYGGRLPQLEVPVLVVHGARDPRTEPGELDALRTALERGARALRRFCILSDAGHSPHSEAPTGDRVTDEVRAFLSVAHNFSGPPKRDERERGSPANPA